MGNGVVFHRYRELDCWAFVVSLTTRNATLQLGPFMLQLFWRSF